MRIRVPTDSKAGIAARVEAWKRFRVAKEGKQPARSMAGGVGVALRVFTALQRSRTGHQHGGTVVQIVNMPSPVATYPVVQVKPEEDR